MPDERLTIKQAAEKLGLSRSRVAALVSSGRLRATMQQTPFGSGWLIDPADLEAVKERKVGWPKGRPRKPNSE